MPKPLKTKKVTMVQRKPVCHRRFALGADYFFELVEL